MLLTEDYQYLTTPTEKHTSLLYELIVTRIDSKKSFFVTMMDIQPKSIPVSLEVNDDLRTSSGKMLTLIIPVLEILYIASGVPRMILHAQSFLSHSVRLVGQRRQMSTGSRDVVLSLLMCGRWLTLQTRSVLDVESWTSQIAPKYSAHSKCSLTTDIRYKKAHAPSYMQASLPIGRV